MQCGPGKPEFSKKRIIKSPFNKFKIKSIIKPVQLVSEYRVSAVVQVDPYLMQAAGFRKSFYQGIVIKTEKSADYCDCRFTGIFNPAFFPHR